MTGCNFTNCDLKNSDFTSNLVRCNLTNTNLTNTKFSLLYDCDCTDADLDGTILYDCIRVNFTNSYFDPNLVVVTNIVACNFKGCVTDPTKTIITDMRENDDINKLDSIFDTSDDEKE